MYGEALQQGVLDVREGVRGEAVLIESGKHQPQPLVSGAGGGDRTRTPLRIQDFKSCAYAYFATPAQWRDSSIGAEVGQGPRLSADSPRGQARLHVSEQPRNSRPALRLDHEAIRRSYTASIRGLSSSLCMRVLPRSIASFTPD